MRKQIKLNKNAPAKGLYVASKIDEKPKAKKKEKKGK